MHNQTKKFCSQAFIDIYEKYFNINFEQKTELGVKIVEKGIIHPFQIYDYQNMWTKPSYGGVSDENLNYIEESSLVCVMPNMDNLVIGRINGFNPNYDFKNIDYHDETVVYMGKMDDAWGHFVQESVTRLWYLADNPNCNYKLAYISGGNDRLLEYIHLFGISPERLIRIDKPTKFKEVIIPDASYRMSDFYHAKFKTIFNKMKENIPAEKHKKIYFTRAACPEKTRVLGEKALEDIFRENGYKIVAPEEISAREKIALIKGADIVAEVFGSGCLNIFFAKEGTKHIILNRSNFFYPEITFIDKISKSETYYIEAFKEFLPVHGGVGPFLLTLTPYLEEFFNKFRFEYKSENLLKDFDLNSLIFYKQWVASYSNPSGKSLLKMANNSLDIDLLVDSITSAI